MPENKLREHGIYHAPWEQAFSRIMSPLEEFIKRQTTSSVLLMLFAILALFLYNSDYREAYEHFFHQKLAIELGEWSISMTVHHWINEALMVLFFFVIGLELKRELMVGELSDLSKTIVPIAAAIGGMLVPALFYFAFNPSGHAANGWGIPMATDIAFAIGALSLLGARVPKSLVTFLVALAIVDDLGAVVVIAVFYTDELNLSALITSGVFMGVMIVFNRFGIRRTLPYVINALFLWYFLLLSGVHATLAGVFTAFAIPSVPKYDAARFVEKVKDLVKKIEVSYQNNPSIIHNDDMRSNIKALGSGASLTQAPLQKLEHALHLPVAYLVIPIFALANGGIPIDPASLGQLLQQNITLGIIAGLSLGKLVGVAGFSWLVVKLGWSELPKGLTNAHVIGVGLLAGIGFTMSIFIAELGFIHYPEDLVAAKTGILLASLLSGIAGVVWLVGITKKPVV